MRTLKADLLVTARRPLRRSAWRPDSGRRLCPHQAGGRRSESDAVPPPPGPSEDLATGLDRLLRA